MTNALYSSQTSWEHALKNAITSPEELIAILNLDKSILTSAIAGGKQFSLKIPRGFAARMTKNNPLDPLLMQVLPLAIENNDTLGFSSDPLNEAAVNPLPGLLHKYSSRVLLTFAGSCAINCRYCFRRHFNYEENNPGTKGWDSTIEYVANNTDIHEIILSGGDPLLAKDKTLRLFTDKCADIPHLKTIRIHSRIPIVLPERIDVGFIKWIKSIKQKVVLVTHCNHSQEINKDVQIAMTRLKKVGVTLLNQSVILKGVNDTVISLVQLSEALFSVDILPYYLHIFDKVAGTAHFDLDHDLAKSLHAEMYQCLPGYLVPRLAIEIPGGKSKHVLA
jgi:EF-P beta-lysylation protein EpmB